jgi:hypothetical protein
MVHTVAQDFYLWYMQLQSLLLNVQWRTMNIPIRNVRRSFRLFDLGRKILVCAYVYFGACWFI